MDPNYWTRSTHRVSRRAVLRGAAVAGAGLSAAALIGCGDDEATSAALPTAMSGGGAGPSAPSASGSSSPAPSGSNVPAGAQVPIVEGEPQYGGTFAYALASTFAQFDMHTALGSSPFHFMSERALELDEWTAELRGAAVESWEVADDQGLELIMHVRPGLAMHDKEPWNGRPFDAEDMAFNLERNAGLYAEAEGIPRTSFQRRSMVAYLESAEAVDDLTVRVKMERPNGALFNGLAEIRMQLMPREVVDIGFDDPTKLGSFGAWKMVDFQQGVREEYAPHELYYRQGEPYFDRYIRLALQDRASILAAFVDGQTQLFSGPLPHERETALQAKSDVLTYSSIGSNWDHLRWNTENPALADHRVRTAFARATDRQDINDAHYGPGGWGWGAITHPDYPEGWNQDKVKTLPGFNPETKDADRADAAAMLEAAGYPNGAGIEIVIVPQVTARFEEHALRFQDQMNALFSDIHIEIQRPSDSTAFATRQAERDFEALSYTITVVPDIFLELHSQYHSDGSRNYGSFVDEEADALIESGIGALTPEDRVAIADELQTRLVDEWNPNLVFNITPDLYLLQGNIGGFDTTFGPWGFGGYRFYNKGGRWYYV